MMKNYLILFFTLWSPLVFSSWNGKIIQVLDKKEITRLEFINGIKNTNYIVLGEKHYTSEVQNEEGRIISEVVLASKNENNFSTSWEFLNAISQPETFSLFNRVRNKEMTTEEFLFTTQGNKKSSVYSPIINATASLGGELFGVNLSRAQKSPVVEKGLGALDPILLPPNFKLGGRNYLERFTEVMKDHATAEQISNYFAAQSLVDDVTAFHMTNDSNYNLKFLIIGSFHSQFNDGVVNRLKFRNPNSTINNIEIIDAADYTEQEIELVLSDKRYGYRADYVIFVNEPTGI